MARRFLSWGTLTVLATSALGAQERPGAPVEVWVNTRSGVYHCPGTTYYGKTAQGEFLSEPVARERGYRANGGKACGPLQGAASDVARALAGSPMPTLPDSAPVKPRKPTRSCVVLKITDGDTIGCQELGNVRLIGVDAPEDDQPPFGLAARTGLASLLPVGATIALEPDVRERDSSGRLLAYLWYDGEMLNWKLVRSGWAVSLRWPPDTAHASAFEAAERRAQAESRGLWLIGGFGCRPEEHRQKKC